MYIYHCTKILLFYISYSKFAEKGSIFTQLAKFLLAGWVFPEGLHGTKARWTASFTLSYKILQNGARVRAEKSIRLPSTATSPWFRKPINLSSATSAPRLKSRVSRAISTFFSLSFSFSTLILKCNECLTKVKERHFYWYFIILKQKVSQNLFELHRREWIKKNSYKMHYAI